MPTMLSMALACLGILYIGDITTEPVPINQIFSETLEIVLIECNKANEGDLKAGLSNLYLFSMLLFFLYRK